MKATVEAIFEDGIFRPVARLEISEGEHVRLTVETVRPERENPLDLAVRVYKGLRPDEIDEIERIALDRPDLS